MIDSTSVKEFQKKNKQSDVLGVIRTMYPNVEVETLLSKRNRSVKTDGDKK